MSKTGGLGLIRQLLFSVLYSIFSRLVRPEELAELVLDASLVNWLIPQGFIVARCCHVLGIRDACRPCSVGL